MPPKTRETRHARSSYPWPTPKPRASDWMSELSEALKPHPDSGIGSEELLSLSTNLNSSLSDNPFSRTLNPAPPEVEIGRVLYSKLQKYPHLRQSLPSVNAARAFKYGSRAYGQKKWYSEDFNISRGLRSNKSRRQFRFGIKSNVEFLIQLDLENLRSCILDTTFELNKNSSSPSVPLLSDGSFLDLMRKMNATRCTKFCEIMNRLHGNLHFSQSLNEYFATDDMLEPPLLLVAEAIRKGPDLGTFLRGGSVAATAMMYRHRASPNDHDWGSLPKSTSKSETFGSRASSHSVFRNQKYKYKFGYCFQFQNTGSCETTECQYMHKCSKCKESTHGEDTCQKI